MQMEWVLMKERTAGVAEFVINGQLVMLWMIFVIKTRKNYICWLKSESKGLNYGY